jgi:hypothetical protein
MMTCPQCEAPLQSELLPGEPSRCPSCGANLLLGDDGLVEVRPEGGGEGEGYEVEPSAEP